MASRIDINDPKLVIPGRLLNNHVFQFDTQETKKKTPLRNGQFNSTLWTAYVGVLKKKIDPKTFTNTIKGKLTNDEIGDLFQVYTEKIESSYFNSSTNMGSLIAFTVVQTSTKGGDSRFGSITFVASGKNIGKKNATNVFTQALKEAMSKYNSRISKNDFYSPMLAGGEGILNDNMLARITDLTKEHHGNFSLQIKYDGTRCLSTLDGSSNSVVCYSRSLEKVELTDLHNKEITQLINSVYNSINTLEGDVVVLDGELYKHGLSLQKINGIFRNTGATNHENYDKKIQLKYFVYDVFILRNDQPTPLTYIARKQIRDTMRENNPNLDRIEIVQDIELTHPEEIFAKYNELIESGYEGMIMRLNDKAYNNANRSRMIKLKPVIREEFPIVGFEQGKGKFSGLIKLKCEITVKTIRKGVIHKRMKNKNFQVNESQLLSGDTTFFVVPKADEEYKRELYQEFIQVQDNGYTKFQNEYMGKLYTVEFQDYSDDLKPQRPIGIDFY